MKLNRRTVILGGATLGFTGFVAGCAPATTSNTNSDSNAGSAAEVEGDVTGTLRLHVGGDTNVRDLWQDTLGPAFTKKYPDVTIEVDHDLHSERSQQSLAKLTAAGDSKDPGMDFIDDGWVIDAAEAKLLLEIDGSVIPVLDELPENVVAQGLGQAVPYRSSSVLLAYDPEKVPTPPKTLTDLLTWIEKNPGEFAYNSPSTGGSGEAFVTSVLDLYIPDDVREEMTTSYNKDNEKYWDEGFAKLKSLGPAMYGKGTYPNGNSQSIELLVNGQVSMIPVWSDQFISGQESGQIPERIKVTQVEDPSFTGGASYFAIPNNSQNKPAALALAKFALSPEGQQLISEKMAGYPIIPLDEMPQEVQDKFEGIDTSELRPGYFGDHSQDRNKLWDEKVPTA